MAENLAPLVDLSGTPLAQIAQLSAEPDREGEADPEVDADRLVLRRALARVRAESVRPSELFAGHNNSPGTTMPPDD